MYQRFLGKRESPFHANPGPRYLFLAMQIPAYLVGEVGREFQLDEIAPGPPVGVASRTEQVASTQALLRNLDELLGRSHQMNLVPTTSRERKP